MDYEKKYRDLVEAVKELQEANHSDEGIQKWVEDNVPELAESKDEKIRKAIYGWIYTRPSQFFDDGFSKEEMLAWLEKQGKKGARYKYTEELLEADAIYQMAMNDAMVEEAKNKAIRALSNLEISKLLRLEKQGEQKLTNSYCQEHCKGFQETGKCFADGDCKAKTTYKDELKEDNRPVTERIKTFDDACQELNTKALSGDETAAFLLADYESNADNINNPQTLAYMRLAIIAYALNEGWEPKFEKGEYRYFPWFYFYNKEQYDKLDIEEKERCVLRFGVYMNSYNGFVYVNAYNDASFSFTFSGSRLVFRTRELAAYAGRQFTEEWADFVFKTE